MAMGQMVSPGIYTRIIDLSQYLADIPGTVGFLPILSKKGPDNKLQFVSSKEQFINLYGEPNILDYGKYYGQGPYVAWQHLGVSSHLYVLRALPDDATYAHMVIGMQLGQDEIETTYSSSTAGSTFMNKLELKSIYLDGQDHVNRQWDSDKDAYVETTDLTYPSINHVNELESFLGEEMTGDYMWTDYVAGSVEDTNGVEVDTVLGDYSTGTGGVGLNNGFLVYFRAIGRGDSYNNYSIKLSRNSNPEKFGIYILDIYQTQDDGDNMIVESFNVAFDEVTVDDTGESLFIEDVVNKFSKDIRCSVNREALRVLEEYKASYYLNDPTLPEDAAALYNDYESETDGYKATKIQLATYDYEYAVEVLEEFLTDLTTARKLPTTTSVEVVTRNEAISNAISLVSSARSDVNITKRNLEDAYQLDILDMGDVNSETAEIEPWPMAEGSEGSLVYTDQNTGKVATSDETATQLLSEAYLGLLEKPDNVISGNVWKRQFVDEIFDLDWIYFSLVYDAGYPPDVKDSALTLCDVYRRDCMLISDCGDNIDYDDVETYVGGSPSIPSGRLWNSRYAARYESYSKIYDTFTGRNLWVSPVYHMAQVIPLNDRLFEIWYASAGFNRGTLSTVKELRWSPKLGERDKLYLLQVNPIVHFPQGYTIWGNLTTQKRPSSLQDINVMRLVLYIKRAIEQYCKYFIFEFNDGVTHDQIKAGIIPFLDRIRAKRGLVDFDVEVGADDYEFKNKICHVNVTLQPMKVIEKIELNLYVK